MRPSILLAGTALVIGCAPRAVTTAPVQPKAGELTVQMLPPAGGNVHYSLSEPAYVAVFAITPGSGIGLVVEEPESGTAQPRPAGLNRIPGRIRPLAPATPRHTEGRGQYRLPTYYVVASRYPLPVAELLVAVNSSAGVPTSVREATEVISDALTKGVPAEAWDADLFRYPPNPSTSASRRGGGYPTCEERAFNRTTLIAILGCQERH